MSKIPGTKVLDKKTKELLTGIKESTELSADEKLQILKKIKSKKKKKKLPGKNGKSKPE